MFEKYSENKYSRNISSVKNTFNPFEKLKEMIFQEKKSHRKKETTLPHKAINMLWTSKNLI
jgi:hypothetical protein